MICTNHEVSLLSPEQATAAVTWATGIAPRNAGEMIALAESMGGIKAVFEAHCGRVNESAFGPLLDTLPN